MSGRAARVVAAALIVTLTVGFVLRWALAGGPMPPGGFTRWRHVHSHLGYYGVLFPLVWPAWRELGGRGPGRWIASSYLIAVVVAMAGFVRAGGYGPLAMAGSTGVLAVWLSGAWRNRRRTLLGHDWLGSTPLSLVLAAACVPAVAVASGRDPALARALLHAFLTLLLVGVVVPAALGALRAPAPRAVTWFVGTALSALWLGPLPNVVTGFGLVVLAWLVARASWRAPQPVDRRLAWLAVAVGFVALAAHVIPNNHPVAIGSLHFLVLGPLLDGLTARSWPADLPRRVATLAAAGAMGAALVAQGTICGAWTPTAAAWAGTVALVAWVVRVSWPDRVEMVQPGVRGAVAGQPSGPDRG